MKRLVALALVLLATGFARPAAAQDVAPATSASRRFLDEIDRELGKVRSSKYSHLSSVDEEQGRFDLDCSGFLDYALARVEPDALLPIRKAAGGKKRALAEDYVHALEMLTPGSKDGCWSRLARADELRPGDLIAWLTPSESKARGNRNTGHVLVVHGRVTKREGFERELLVPIADSTEHGTHDGDSRGKDSGGLGTGRIGLVTDDHGAPTAYRWAGARSKRAAVTTIVLGRLTR